MIKSKRYKDTRTGEIKTQIPIMEMQYFVEVKEPKIRQNFSGVKILNKEE